MTKVKLMLAILMTSLVLVIVPVKQEAVACNVVCLLQMGGQQVQDLGSRIKAILGVIQQTVTEWLSDAQAWIAKNMQKAWGGAVKGLDKIGLKTYKAPNLRDSKTGIAANKSYNLAVAGRGGSGGGKTVSGEIGAAGTAAVMTNVAETKGNIETRAQAKQNELLATKGTLQGRMEEEKRKNYVAQKEAIDGLARALVAKNALEDLEELAKQLDELLVTIQQGSATAPSTEQPGDTPAPAPEIVPATGHNMGAAIKNNISVRLLWDNLLTTQQQIMAMRLKASTVQAIGEMEDVSKVAEIEESKTDDKSKDTKKDTASASTDTKTSGTTTPTTGTTTPTTEKK